MQQDRDNLAAAFPGLQCFTSWMLIAALFFAPCNGFTVASTVAEPSAESSQESVLSTRVTYYITPDYAEVWEHGKRFEVIKHYRLNGQKIATRDEEGLKFHYTDHLNSATRVADVAGNEIKAHWYTPFGSGAKERGEAIVRYKYNGKEHDNSGVYYYGARYHDSDLGRFMSADTILPNIYDSQALNRYAYVRNNPVLLVDPDGHLFFVPILLYIGGMALFAATSPAGSQAIRPLLSSALPYVAPIVAANLPTIVAASAGVPGEDGSDESFQTDDEDINRAIELWLANYQDYLYSLTNAKKRNRNSPLVRQFENLLKHPPKLNLIKELTALKNIENLKEEVAVTSGDIRGIMPEMQVVWSIDEVNLSDPSIEMVFLIDKKEEDKT